jgi:hypothetical protein
LRGLLFFWRARSRATRPAACLAPTAGRRSGISSPCPGEDFPAEGLIESSAVNARTAVIPAPACAGAGSSGEPYSVNYRRTAEYGSRASRWPARPGRQKENVARLAGMTHTHTAVPLSAERSSDRIPKKPFGVLGQHSKTWSDLKSVCLPPTPRPAAK